MNTKAKAVASVKGAAGRTGGRQKVATEPGDCGVAGIEVEMRLVEIAGLGLVVSAKAVHAGLGVGRDFTNWFKGRVCRFGFEAGLDYWSRGGVSKLDSSVRGNQNEQRGGDHAAEKSLV